MQSLVELDPSPPQSSDPQRSTGVERPCASKAARLAGRPRELDRRLTVKALLTARPSLRPGKQPLTIWMQTTRACLLAINRCSPPRVQTLSPGQP
jgi:hypothetical protein